MKFKKQKEPSQMPGEALGQSQGQMQVQGHLGTYERAANQLFRGGHWQEVPCDENVEDEGLVTAGVL